MIFFLLLGFTLGLHKNSKWSVILNYLKILSLYSHVDVIKLCLSPFKMQTFWFNWIWKYLLCNLMIMFLDILMKIYVAIYIF